MNLQIEGNTVRKIDASIYAKPLALVEETPAASHVPTAFSLDEHGMIRECGKTVEKLFGYHQLEVVWQHISCLFPQLSEVALMQADRLNPMFQYICHCGHVFEAIGKRGEIIKCNLSFFLIENDGTPTLRLIVRPVAEANS